MKFTVRSKLIALSVFLVTLVMVNVTYFFTIREVKSKRTAVEGQMERIARNIATVQLVERQNWAAYQDYISRLMAINDDIVYVAVYDERNWLRAHTLNPDLLDLELSQPLSKRKRSEIVQRLAEGLVAEESQGDLSTQKVNILVGDRVLGSVQVGFSLIEINDELRARIIRNIWVGLLFIVIISIISFFLSSRLTRPLEKLTAAMPALASGNFEQRVEIKNKDEIGQLAQSFNAMVEGLRERDIIEKLGQELGKSLQLQQLSYLISNRLKGAIGADSAKLYLAKKDENGVFYDPAEELNGESRDSFQCDKKTLSFLLGQPDGFNLESGPEYVKKVFECIQGGKNDLLVPMVVKNKLLGLLVFGLQNSANSFTTKQCHFAAILAGQAAFALENTVLYDELRDQERLKRELEIAREVQHKLLPMEMPKVKGFQFDGFCEPAWEVGGDYFDFFHLNSDEMGVVIADVSGKGTSASFYMAELKGMMTTLTAMHSSPKTLLTDLNTRLYKSLEKKVFATMIYGVLNIRTCKFTFARAGHNSLLQITANGTSKLITPGGIGLGLDPGTAFGETLIEKTIALRKGDTLLLYTDGITEWMNDQQEIFGEDRLLEIVRLNGSFCPGELRKKIFEEVRSFSNGAKHHDDLTMVVMQMES